MHRAHIPPPSPPTPTPTLTPTPHPHPHPHPHAALTTPPVPSVEGHAACPLAGEHPHRDTHPLDAPPRIEMKQRPVSSRSHPNALLPPTALSSLSMTKIDITIKPYKSMKLHRVYVDREVLARDDLLFFCIIINAIIIIIIIIYHYVFVSLFDHCNICIIIISSFFLYRKMWGFSSLFCAFSNAALREVSISMCV